MPSPSKSTCPSPLSPTAASSSPVPHDEGGVPLTEDEEDVDQLAFTLDSPSRPQLEFFKKVFNTGSWNYMALRLKKLPGPSRWTSGVGTLNMLDDSDALDRDHQELSQFLDTQRQETVAASKWKRASSPVRPGGATSSEAPAKTSHKRHRHLSPPASLPSVVPRTGLEYSRVLDQFQTLERALPGRAEQTLLERLREIQEELITAQEEREEANRRRSASTRRNSELRTSLEQQQGLADESNALAARQWQHIEALQEEAHQFRDRASFLECMVREFPEEGFYNVSLPPVSELEGELTRVHEDLRRVTTFAHCLYRSSPGSALQHHNQHLGGLIEAMIALLRQGLDSTDPDLIVRNFQLVLEYLQASRGIHGELHVRTLSSVHYFFNNAADRDDGLYRLVLDNSQFLDDFPFATIAQHAGYAPPFESALEPPLHCHMFALDTALPYHSAGRWGDSVPAFPSLDRFTRDWEELMVSYIHHLTDTALPEPPVRADVAVGDDTVLSLPVSQPVPLFLPEQPSPTSPSPPRTSPVPPPLFGSVAPLTIDLTGDDDDLYESLEEA
ncbi:hypothetical protein EV359DRAFT_69012, partial [Lentinula novae-zelandiae]